MTCVNDSPREARLVEQHRDELGVGREVGMEALDRDFAREPGVPRQAPEVDARHPARRDLFVECVAADHARLGRRTRG